MRVEGQTVYAMWGKNRPGWKVKSGSELTFVTRDCFDNQLLEEDARLEGLDWDAINPATGPVWIEGALPGDVLKVTIREIRVAELGTMAAIPGNGVLGELVKENALKHIRVRDGIAELSPGIRIPCSPMIGVIGVAPAGEEAIPCGEPGSHGGNMDNTRIGAGTVLYLPVFQEGALLAMGDVHACMGDGEIMVTGLEIPAEVDVQVEVLKGVSIRNPMLETEEACYTIASDEDLEKAVFSAVYDMTQVVMRQLNMPLEEAGMLLSAMGNLQFCQVVDPKRTVRMEMKRSVLRNMLTS